MTADAIFDVAIAGGGIVGSACALACARRGLRVALVERDALGSGATAAGMGHIVVMDDSDAQFALTRYSQQLWHQLDLPPAAEYEQIGTLWIATDAEEMDAAERKHAWYADRGLPTQLLTANQLAQAEPKLIPGLVGALLIPGDAVVYPPCAAKFFLDQARTLGAEIKMGVAATHLLPEGGVRLADGTHLSADRVINVAGPWSPELMPGVPVRKRKGHLVITDRAPGFVRHQIVELGYLKSAHSVSKDSVAFNVQPRKTQQVLVGSSRQFDAASTEVDHAILSRMLSRAGEYLPGLNDLVAIRTWTGHRPATPDKLPLIGPSLFSDRIWLATGHEGLGITTSLGTGRLLADLLLGQPTEIPSEPFSPSRYANGASHHE